MDKLDVFFPLQAAGRALTGVALYELELARALCILPELRVHGGIHECNLCNQALAHYITKRLSAPQFQEETNSSSGLLKATKQFLISKPALVRSVQSLLPTPFKKRVKKIKTKYGSWPLYHEANFIPRPYPGPSIATIHDLSFWHFPKTHPPGRVAALNYLLPRTIRTCSAIITDSHIVSLDIKERFPEAAERIYNIPLAASDFWYPATDEEIKTILKPLFRREPQQSKIIRNIPNFILAVGTLEPRKDLEGLIKAWRALPKKLRRNFHLVLAGTNGWENQILMQEIAKLKEKGELSYLGYVSPHELRALYSSARALAYPSLYEGFGLPVLEAMQCGCPVICREGTSMTEFTGEAALLCAPAKAGREEQIETLTYALMQFMESDLLCAHKRQQGLAQAQHYTWQKTAKQTAEIYYKTTTATC